MQHNLTPDAIESMSMQIIRTELGDKPLPKDIAPVVLRCIHASADFEYYDTLTFTPGVMQTARELLHSGATIVTDTNMALAGIRKRDLKRLGCQALCFMTDPEVTEAARTNGTTRAAAAVDKAAALPAPIIYACGNAPTALLRICELQREGRFAPALVIGVPVGFVNVVYAKEQLLTTGIPAIVARGRKGGSTIAAAIVNALLMNT